MKHRREVSGKERLKIIRKRFKERIDWELLPDGKRGCVWVGGIEGYHDEPITTWQMNVHIIKMKTKMDR